MSIDSELLELERTIDDGTYRAGGWQRLLSTLRELDKSELAPRSPIISRISNKLNRRHGYPEFPFTMALAAELAVFFISVWLLAQAPILVRLVGVGMLTLCLQPLIKVLTGILLGVRYDHAYLWYFEPRFKMNYGSYLLLGDWQRIGFHIAGSIGTPLALMIGAVALADNDWLAALCILGALVGLLMQVAAFVAAWLGVKRVGPFYLGTLTTPATLALELRAMLR